MIKNDAIATLDLLNSSLDAEYIQLQNYQNQESTIISNIIVLNDDLNSTNDQLGIVRQTIQNINSNIGLINQQVLENNTIKNDAVIQAEILNGSIEAENILLDAKIADLISAHQSSNDTDLLIQSIESDITIILSNIADLETQLTSQSHSEG